MRHLISPAWAGMLALPLLAATGASHAQAIPVQDFAKHADVNQVTLSPNGDYVAMTIPSEDDTETQLHVVKLDGSGSTQVMRFGKQQHVSDILWTSDTQLVVSRAKMRPLKAQPESYGELMSTDIHGKTQETLFAYERTDGNFGGRRKDQGFADVVKILADEPGMVLVRFDSWARGAGEEPPTAIYKVDTRTGNRQEVERVDEPAGFRFDQSGRARILVTWDDNDDPVLQYRPGAGNEWQPMPKSLAGRSIGSAKFDADDNTLYALVSDAGEPQQLYKIDLAAGTRTKLAGREDVDIAYTINEGHDGIPFAVVYNADKPTLQYLDSNSEWAQLHRGLLQSFPGQMLSIIEISRDGRTVLFSTWSDRDPGSYYVFDRDAKKAQLVAQAMPWIKPERMAATRPVEFTSSDGRKLFGFYTAKGDGPKPLVVMPHGGPHGPYDSWGFNSDAQFLASRGYGVLQVNFRGSGGRGYNFEKSGYREWGGRMMDDIADGVKWAIANKLADPQSICTYGASFGGYAALMQPIRYPDLYKCAIGYVGVYDLTVMHKAGDIPDTRSGRRYLERVLGKDSAVLVANSPARQAARLKIPVMLVQGKDDRRVPMDQFEALKDGFAAAGTPVETFVVDGEGHGFYKTENRVELYRRMEAFLARHIGGGSK